MAHAYTPGLRVTERATIRRKRLLPIPGEVLVEEGQEVDVSAVVARTHLPGKVQAVNVVNRLGISPQEIREYMRKQEGDPVEKGDAIAENRPWIKWFKTQVRSPIQGTIESISEITGQVLLREPARPLEISAYIEGRVVEVIPRQGVVIEASCSFLQGIFGIGGETDGVLVLAVGKPEDTLTPERLSPDHRDKIVVGGAYAAGEVLARAREVGLKGLVVGGVEDQALRDMLGYDLGVAITGTEDVGFTMILTEGFGRIAMASRTFELLASREGSRASISGATQIRAGVIRPEIIISWKQPSGGDPDLPPLSIDEPSAMESAVKEGLKVGDFVRLIREPYHGAIGRIKDLPPQLQPLPTESLTRVVIVELSDGTLATAPRANVETLVSA